MRDLLPSEPGESGESDAPSGGSAAGNGRGVFVSYASADLERVQELAAALKRAGVPVWLDRAGIPGGANYGPEIVAAIRGCSALVLCCSTAAFRSRNVRQEVALAWKHERPILPLLLEPGEVPDDLAYWLEADQWIEVLHRPEDEWLPEVLRSLRRLGVAAAPPPRGAPPGSTDTPGPVRLPTPLTALLGRDAEVREVAELLADHRLVTLTGPGGVGKTRLAIDAARTATPVFPEGMVFVDLAPVRDPALVLPAIAQALEVREAPGIPLDRALAAALGNRRILLVLDNFEHVVAAAAGIAALLATCPHLVVLATSRAALAVRGEHIVAVEPLAVPVHAGSVADLGRSPAAALFIDRAQSARPGFALTPETAPIVAAICARLDGLPLAIELAAARVKMLPPAALLERLTQTLPTLTGGARDLPDRQRTLRDTIAWSHDLLSPDEQALFRRLGVFVGGCTLEEAEAIANPGGVFDTVDVLAGLMDQSLVRQVEGSGDEPRFGMLETVREFAQDQLATSGEDATLRAAHAAYFLRLAEHANPHVSGAEQGVWHRRLEADHPNFRVALETLAMRDDHDAYLRLTANLALFWWMRGHLAEGRRYLDRALSRAPAPTPQRAEALIGIGRIAASQGDFAAAETWLRQSVALARSLIMPALLSWALFELGQAVEYAGDLARAVPLYEAALADARDRNDAHATSVVLFALSEVAYGRGDLAAAGRLNEETIALLRSSGEPFVLSVGLLTSGEVALGRGDLPRAVGAYQEALDLALGIDMPWAIAGALAGFAAVPAARGHHGAAAELLGAAATIRDASHQDRFPNFYHHAHTTQTVRAALGEAAFVAAWEAGRALSAEEAIDLPRSLGLLAKGRP